MEGFGLGQPSWGYVSIGIILSGSGFGLLWIRLRVEVSGKIKV